MRSKPDKNAPIDENWDAWPFHPRITEIAADDVIDVRIATIAILSEHGEKRLAERFADRLLQTAEEEQFIRSIGRAANLNQLATDINSALGQSGKRAVETTERDFTV